MPHHLMKPKAGDCVVLMRNSKKGMLRGRRLAVNTLHQKLYHCRQSNIGEAALIPQINYKLGESCHC
jgi:hypothetical protein